jgi:hypothetical protein
MELGPLRWRGQLPAWAHDAARAAQQSWHLARIIVHRLEIRADLDLFAFSVGIKMATSRDWGLYLGFLNVQIEFDFLWDEPLGMVPLEVRIFSPHRVSWAAERPSGRTEGVVVAVTYPLDGSGLHG